MSVLVTGAGVIGSLTAELLAARGERVVMIDIHTPQSLPDGVIFETCDVSEVTAIADVLRRHAVPRFIHTAAMLSTGIAEHLTYDRAQPTGTFQPAALFDLAQRVQNFGGRDVGDRPVTNHRGSERQEPFGFRKRRSRPALARLLGYQFARDHIERVGGCVGLCNPLDALLLAWIRAQGQQRFGFIPALACLLQRQIRVRAKGQLLLLALRTDRPCCRAGCRWASAKAAGRHYPRVS